MDRRSLIQNTFDTYADGYEEKFNRNPLANYQRKSVYETIAPFLKNTRSILDIGCGPGSDFAFYKSLNLDVDAIDISANMVKLARQKAAAINLNANITNIALESFRPGKQYDTIMMNFGVINILENLPLVLKQLKSLLKSNGTLIIVSMPPFHFFPLLELLLKFKFKAFSERLFRKKAILTNGFRFYYYSQNNFINELKIVKRLHLCPFLPSPDQYQKSRWAKQVTAMLQKFDHQFATKIPDFLGGDHICYVTQVPKVTQVSNLRNK